MLKVNKKDTILLVDDNDKNIAILTNILKDTYKLIKAKDEKETFDLLSQKNKNIVSAIILDEKIVNNNGFELLKKIKSELNLKDIPIIVARDENNSQNNKEELALKLGVNDYIQRPYADAILKHRLDNIIYIHDASHFVDIVKNDTLTEVYSKEYFYLKAEQILKQNEKDLYDIICCDIVKFKLINDLYGKEFGNKVLQLCGKTFNEAVKNVGICGRMGPDVFVCLVVRNQEKYKEYFDQIIKKINKLNIKLNIEIKFGIYPIENCLEPIYLMCDRAKLSIESIKETYGVVCKYYDDNVRKKLIEEQYMMSHMTSALENNQFEVFFQPKYEIKTKKIIGAEALVRWNDPKRGLILPNKFIPFFEKNGFITNLDKYVWKQCFILLRNWERKGNKIVPLSMNVSRADLYNLEVDKFLIELVKKYNVKPQWIHLEITESAYTENSVQLINNIKHLKNLGFKIEMDDFGTGYSSLNMLADLPIDVLKLDIGFMQNKEEINKRSILSFVISLAKWMNLEVIAEGVETKEQAEMLKTLGCKYAQGYYFKRPTSIKDFEKLLLSIPQIEANNINLKLDKTEKNNSSILLITEEDEDKKVFEDIFKDSYTLLFLDYKTEIHSVLSSNQKLIKAIIFCYNKNLEDKKIEQVVSEGKFYNLPVVIALANKDYVEKAISLGVTDFLTKPYKEISTKNRINLLINNAKLLEESIETEIEKAIGNMKKRAQQDCLTGVLNRSEYEMQVQEQLSQVDEQNAYFIMLDLDNFKSINDVYGHNIGDNALKTLAEYLHTIFAEKGIIGRMGGDEFSVFVSDIKSSVKIENYLNQLCNSMFLEIKGKKITCSCGVCKVSDCCKDFLSIYENADIALLNAKNNGKGQYVFYKIGMEIPIEIQIEENAMRLLDNTQEGTFVCDTSTDKVIYINETACVLLGKTKRECIGKFCYELFWKRNQRCERCKLIDKCKKNFYEETTLFVDDKTMLHMKAREENWNGKKVKVHYLSKLENK